MILPSHTGNQFPNLDIRPQTVCRQFLTIQFTLGSRPKRAGNNTMNTENEKKAKKQVTAMEVQKMHLLKHAYLFSSLLAVLQKNWIEQPEKQHGLLFVVP